MDSFAQFLKKNKPLIDERIGYDLKTKKKELIKASGFGLEVIEKLISFTKLGKSIRGGLLIFTAKVYGCKNEIHLFDIAAGLEVLQSALLIHDDIMDNDLLRRGKPTIFAQYAPPLEYGKSMAICIGDITLYLGLEVIHDATRKIHNQANLLKKVIHEISLVVFAQMDDISFGNRKKELTSEEIERIYKYKTSRYTFSLPMALGALIARQNDQEVHLLEKIGEQIGFIFQIRDDEIGFFSDQKIIGKPVGSDIRENKKTLLRFFLFKQAKGKDKTYLFDKFGKKKLNASEIHNLQELAKKYKVLYFLEKLKNRYQKKAVSLINQLSLDSSGKEKLISVIDLINKRKK